MSAKTEVPWVYLCLKVQYACPEAGARLALGIPHAWPANGTESSELPSAPVELALARRESAVAGT